MLKLLKQKVNTETHISFYTYLTYIFFKLFSVQRKEKIINIFISASFYEKANFILYSIDM